MTHCGTERIEWRKGTKRVCSMGKEAIMAGYGTAHPEFYKEIDRGDSGPDTAMVQTWLNGLTAKWPILKRLKVDGKMGEDTEKNVKIFQGMSRLKEDGKVGPDTWKALYAAYAQEHGQGEKYPGIAIKMGDKGAMVKCVQKQLKKLIPSLAADGEFGKDTRMAILSYQGMNGLKMDGVVGEDTWNSLMA